MVYIILKEGEVILDVTPLNSGYVDYVIYKFDWDLDEVIKNLRPWCILREVGFLSSYYKPECLGWIEENKDLPECPRKTLYPVTENSKNKISWCIDRLCKLGYDIEKKNLDHSIYTCDILNELEYLYGKYHANLIFDLFKLPDYCKNFIEDLEKEPSKEGKLRAIINAPLEILEEVYKFFPEDYKTNISFGGSDSKVTPDCMNQEKLGGDVVDNPWKYIKTEIFNTFLLENRYTGQEIKEKLQEIYTKYGVHDRAKVQDIFKYFETSLSDDKSGKYRYKMIRRKT